MREVVFIQTRSREYDTTNRDLTEIASLVSEGVCPCNLYWHNEETTRRYGHLDQLLPPLNREGQCELCHCIWKVNGTEERIVVTHDWRTGSIPH